MTSIDIETIRELLSIPEINHAGYDWMINRKSTTITPLPPTDIPINVTYNTSIAYNPNECLAFTDESLSKIILNEDNLMSEQQDDGNVTRYLYEFDDKWSLVHIRRNYVDIRFLIPKNIGQLFCERQTYTLVKNHRDDVLKWMTYYKGRQFSKKVTNVADSTLYRVRECMNALAQGLVMLSPSE